MLFKLLGRLTWTVLKVVAPPLARRAQKRLTGSDGDGPAGSRRR